jgi:hypothetical protein
MEDRLAEDELNAPPRGGGDDDTMKTGRELKYQALTRAPRPIPDSVIYSYTQSSILRRPYIYIGEGNYCNLCADGRG